MQRREFLSKTASAAMAVTALPLLRRRQQVTGYTYIGEKTDANNVKWNYEMKLNHELLNKFSSFKKESDKKIGLQFSQVPAAGSTTAAKKTEYFYVVSDVTMLELSPKTADVNTKFLSKATDEVSLPSELPKDLRFQWKAFLSVVLYDTRGKEFIKLSYKSETTSTSTYYDDDYCFLTSACVFYKGLPDDCHELRTIRSLRENYMRGTELGDRLLEEYDVVGPAILSSLKTAENRGEILDHLYEHLVIPSVNKIENGKFQEAVEYYAGYVEEMKRRYL